MEEAKQTFLSFIHSSPKKKKIIKEILLKFNSLLFLCAAAAAAAGNSAGIYKWSIRRPINSTQYGSLFFLLNQTCESGSDQQITQHKIIKQSIKTTVTQHFIATVRQKIIIWNYLKLSVKVLNQGSSTTFVRGPGFFLAEGMRASCKAKIN